LPLVRHDVSKICDDLNFVIIRGPAVVSDNQEVVVDVVAIRLLQIEDNRFRLRLGRFDFGNSSLFVSRRSV
jgi:hypothetical protein